MIHEKNGPGWDFSNVFIKQMGYPYYYRDEVMGMVGEKKTDKIGFHTNRERKEMLLRAYERALKEGRLINRDKQSLDQAKTYIIFPTGGCGPAELVDKDKAAYLGHGDRVMADALTVMDKDVMQPKPESEAAPQGTWGARFHKWKQSNKKLNDWQKRYDFR